MSAATVELLVVVDTTAGNIRQADGCSAYLCSATPTPILDHVATIDVNTTENQCCVPRSPFRDSPGTATPREAEVETLFGPLPVRFSFCSIFVSRLFSSECCIMAPYISKYLVIQIDE